mmetsp:Transcript_93734/g.301702  ORF Transcript_93734/g.301702 Transcript_93734/m.301702 type:complete len:93 (+) Transcript_93734:292-570(+)
MVASRGSDRSRSKVLRLLGAFRILRQARVFESFMKVNINEKHRLMLRIGLLAFLVIWWNHMVCCVWYAIGRNAPSETGHHWTDASRNIRGTG